MPVGKPFLGAEGCGDNQSHAALPYPDSVVQMPELVDVGEVRGEGEEVCHNLKPSVGRVRSPI